VLLSRALAVVAESVEEVYFVMDSVFLGPAERQVTEIKFDDDPVDDFPPIFLGDLLSWVERFALEEGPRLLREGGKDGVTTAFSPTVNKLFRLIKATEKISRSSSRNPTRAFHSPRVQRALGELTNQLREVNKLAGQIKRVPRPKLTGVQLVPVSSTTFRLVIKGRYFQPEDGETQVQITPEGKDEPISASEVDVVSEKLINATFDLFNRSKAAAGSYGVTVINPDAGEGSLSNAFQLPPGGSPSGGGRGSMIGVESKLQTPPPLPNGQHGSGGTKADQRGKRH